MKQLHEKIKHHKEVILEKMEQAPILDLQTVLSYNELCKLEENLMKHNREHNPY